MPADLYNDGPDSMAGETKTDTPEMAEERAEAAEGKTALIDSDICPGMQPGDEMVVKIEKVMDKEYLVSYAPPEDEGEEAAEGEEAGEGEGGPPTGDETGGGGIGSYME